MSTMVYKVVLRAKLAGITNDAEHLAWMREHVGEPVENHDMWFSYEPMDWAGPYFKECSWGDDYGVELVLMETVEEFDEELSLGEDELLGHIEKLRALVGEGVPIRFLAYGWYNGVDEPIHW